MTGADHSGISSCVGFVRKVCGNIIVPLGSTWSKLLPLQRALRAWSLTCVQCCAKRGAFTYHHFSLRSRCRFLHEWSLIDLYRLLDRSADYLSHPWGGVTLGREVSGTAGAESRQIAVFLIEATANRVLEGGFK